MGSEPAVGPCIEGDQATLCSGPQHPWWRIQEFLSNSRDKEWNEWTKYGNVHEQTARSIEGKACWTDIFVILISCGAL